MFDQPDHHEMAKRYSALGACSCCGATVGQPHTRECLSFGVKDRTHPIGQGRAQLILSPISGGATRLELRSNEASISIVVPKDTSLSRAFFDSVLYGEDYQLVDLPAEVTIADHRKE